MIYLWHSDEGIPFHKGQESQAELGEKLGIAIAEKGPQLLRPKERRFLTSGFAEGRFFQHTVQVSKSGDRAFFTILSIRFEAAFLGGQFVFVPEKDTDNFMRVILPDQRPYMMVALPGEEPNMVRIVDLVYHYSGKMYVPLEVSFSRN